MKWKNFKKMPSIWSMGVALISQLGLAGSLPVGSKNSLKKLYNIVLVKALPSVSLPK